MSAICSKRVEPSHPMLQYMGRIDDSNPNAPVFTFPSSYVKIRFSGAAIAAEVTNIHGFYENSLGVLLDGVQTKLILPEAGRAILPLAEGLPEGEHELTLFKRMDCCHLFVFHGFLLPQEGRILPLQAPPKRRIEFFGDSVTAGEVSEAVDFCGKVDPPHNGEYSNSYYAYSWYTARLLNAQIHNTAQGGVALLTGTGYYCAPQLLGMEEIYDKVQCNPSLQPMKPWDFTRYTPHVVVVAIGQNDNHPEDIMEPGLEGEKAAHWMRHYAAFIRRLRELYPAATIILATTILCHNANWDLAIDQVCRDLSDEKIHHFLYSNNGCGTPGHIRRPEAEKMAQELSAYILSLGEEIWRDEA